MTDTDKPAHVHQIVIRATPERVWEALTDGELARRYYYGTRIESDFRPGSRYAYVQPNGEAMLDGEILEIVPPLAMGEGLATSVVRPGHGQRFTRIPNAG
jgi:uncharacterized protein YndB with AHSA1/START domain